MMFLLQLKEATKELTHSAFGPRVKKRYIKRDILREIEKVLMTTYTKTTSQKIPYTTNIISIIDLE